MMWTIRKTLAHGLLFAVQWLLGRNMPTSVQLRMVADHIDSLEREVKRV